jgi:hypothetical protein
MKKNKHICSTLDSLFEELGELEEVKAMATKQILALQAERRMKELGLPTTALAARMGTNRLKSQKRTGATLPRRANLDLGKRWR